MLFINRILIILWMVLPFSVFAAKESLVPQNIIENFLKPYSQVEKEAIARDYKNILKLCLSQAKNGQKQLIYVATAGGPGASKTTILENYLHEHPGFVYVDPDQRALKYMINTYLQEINNYAISQSVSYQDLLTKAYVKWRGASNYIANTILNDAYAKNIAIAHGTTSTSESMSLFYKKLKGKGYKIILLLCGSPEGNRLRAVKYREKNQCFMQNDRKDLIEKGQMFFERIPVYFEFADEIQFFWVDNFSKGWIKVGDYSRSAGFKQLHPDFKKFKNSYESFRSQHVTEKLSSFDGLLKGSDTQRIK